MCSVFNASSFARIFEPTKTYLITYCLFLREPEIGVFIYLPAPKNTCRLHIGIANT